MQIKEFKWNSKQNLKAGKFCVIHFMQQFSWAYCWCIWRNVLSTLTMLQYTNMPDYFSFKTLFNIFPPYSLWRWTSTKTSGQWTFITIPQKSPILGPKGVPCSWLYTICHYLQRMPRMAFSCQFCPSEHGVTGCLIQHLRSQERGDSFFQSRE